MKKPAHPRLTAIGITAMVVGLVVIALSLLNGASSAGGTNASSTAESKIDPVAPIDPNDKDAREPGEDQDIIDPTDPYARSFGTSGRRTVTVRVSGNGYLSFSVSYRDRKKGRPMYAESFANTRKVKGRFPLAVVVIQVPGGLPGAATKATCTIIIDGTEVSKKTVSKPWAVDSCVA